ncbi:MAG: prepilin peptidase [Actinomycetaceae bacterium]|nr:prepilin peptidase [Actinomycetaceae bacterium]
MTFIIVAATVLAGGSGYLGAWALRDEYYLGADHQRPVWTTNVAIALRAAVLTAAGTWWMTHTIDPPDLWIRLAGMLPLFIATPILTSTDFTKHLLPNKIIAATVITQIPLTVLALVLTQQTPHPLLTALGAALAYFATVFLLRLLPSGIGAGDLKLALPLGWALGLAGWEALILGIILGWVLGGVFALGLLIFTKAKGKNMMAMGPWLLYGTLIAGVL